MQEVIQYGTEMGMTDRASSSRSRSWYGRPARRRGPKFMLAESKAAASSSDVPERPVRLRGALANLPQMPLDVLFEVCLVSIR
jgi:hypothetical protein